MWLSDGLCRLATGGGYAARQLYTDGDEFVLDVQRPTILTGITDVVTAPDLLDRALLVELEPIPPNERTTEQELFRAFDEDRPRILGALLDAVACALKRRANLRLTRLPRLADWGLMATAAEPALGLKEGAVLDALDTTRADAVEVALSASPVTAALRDFIEQRPTKEWTGRVADLLALLTERVAPDVQRSRIWPRTPRGLAGILMRLSPMLHEDGILVQQLDRGSAGFRGQRPWRVRLLDETSPSSPASNGLMVDGFRVTQPSMAVHESSPGPSPELALPFGANPGGDDGDGRGEHPEPPELGDVEDECPF